MSLLAAQKKERKKERERERELEKERERKKERKNDPFLMQAAAVSLVSNLAR